MDILPGLGGRIVGVRHYNPPIMQTASLSDLSDRAREIFCALVDSHLENGRPVGSRTLARRIESELSAATVRNVMQDLEEMGLLVSPHASAGRLPSQPGLRLYVDAILEVADLTSEDSDAIRAELGKERELAPDLFAKVGKLLSGLSSGVSLVLAPSEDRAVRHVEFLQVGEGSVLVALVMEDGGVENRLIDAPTGLTPSAIQEAANFLNSRMRGRTVADAAQEVARSMEEVRRGIDAVAARLVEAGVAKWDGSAGGPDRMIVRGLSNLLADGLESAELERLRRLFDDLERRRTVAHLLDLVREARGVRVFIGSENPLYSLAGSSLVISPYMDCKQQIVGALGVIGPTSINYGRVVPAVDFTARLLGRLLGHEPGADRV